MYVYLQCIFIFACKFKKKVILIFNLIFSVYLFSLRFIIHVFFFIFFKKGYL